MVSNVPGGPAALVILMATIMPFEGARGQALAHHPQSDYPSISLIDGDRLVIVEAGQTFVIRSVRNGEAQTRLARVRSSIGVGTGTRVDAALFERVARGDREATNAARR